MELTRREALKWISWTTAVAGIPGLTFAQTSDILNYPVPEDHPLRDAHPLYALLYDNAIAHTLKVSDREDGERLQIAIIALSRHNFDGSAYIVLPSFRIADRHKIVNAVKMQNPGGNNPTYWATLRLACEGINNPSYSGIVRINGDGYPPLPTDPMVLEFARHIIPANQAGIAIRMNKYPEFASLFGYK